MSYGSADEAEATATSFRDKNFTGPSNRFGGRDALFTFEDCTFKKVSVVFYGEGDGVFGFDGCKWTDCSLTFTGHENAFVFENCTFVNTLMFGGPLETPQPRLLDEDLCETLGQEAQFVFNDCTLTKSPTLDIEPTESDYLQTNHGERDFTLGEETLTEEDFDGFTFTGCSFLLKSPGHVAVPLSVPVLVGEPSDFANLGPSAASIQMEMHNFQDGTDEAECLPKDRHCSEAFPELLTVCSMSGNRIPRETNDQHCFPDK